MEVVRGCLRDGADPNFCVVLGRGEEVGWTEALCEAGADKADDRGGTPLKSAAFFGHTAAVEWLLGHGADWRVIDDWGKTALDWARQNGHAEAVAALNIFANY